MAPHWTLALLLTISALLGISRASITCESNGFAKCVAEKDCQTLIDYRSTGYGCRSNQVCCPIDDVQHYCGTNNKNLCVAEDLCGLKVELRSLSRQCPSNLICCDVKEDMGLSVMDFEPPKRTRNHLKTY